MRKIKVAIIGINGISHAQQVIKSIRKQKDIFERFDDCWSEYASLAETSIFEYAFKLGMQIAIETLTE